MIIKNVKALKFFLEFVMENVNLFFHWYLTFIFIYGLLTILVFVPVWGAIPFHIFTATIALTFGGFLCCLSFTMLILILCERCIARAQKRLNLRKKRFMFPSPAETVKLILAFILFVGGYGGITSGVSIIVKNLL